MSEAKRGLLANQAGRGRAGSHNSEVERWADKVKYLEHEALQAKEREQAVSAFAICLRCSVPTRCYQAQQALARYMQQGTRAPPVAESTVIQPPAKKRAVKVEDSTASSKPRVIATAAAAPG